MPGTQDRSNRGPNKRSSSWQLAVYLRLTKVVD
jgi:hypothetical protein